MSNLDSFTIEELRTAQLNQLSKAELAAELERREAEAQEAHLAAEKAKAEAEERRANRKINLLRKKVASTAKSIKNTRIVLAQVEEPTEEK